MEEKGRDGDRDKERERAKDRERVKEIPLAKSVTREIGTVMTLVDGKNFGFIMRPAPDSDPGNQLSQLFFHFSDICNNNGLPAMARCADDARILVPVSLSLSRSLALSLSRARARSLALFS
jgi:cold shock CspA family protein